MRHFVKYYILTFIVFSIGYSFVFFIEITDSFKAIHNKFSIIFPLVIFFIMIKTYKAKVLTYLEKVGHLLIFNIYLCSISLLVRFLNPANMVPNELENEIGPFKIILFYCVIEFFLGLVMVFFIKQKDVNH